MAKLYRKTIGEGDINKVKHQRNLQILNQFPTFTKEAAIQINNVLHRLEIFKFESDEMKLTVSTMDRVQTLSLNIHIETLKDAINKLHMYQQRFDGRINEANQV
ncbi:unnamed protein product [Didymodactylos carnosus]|uniref:Uncharacterized protein n=2 Tax=Didymodactylos carnosus TaxID=1234261 RepID=A0A8S2FHI7_9BILA|nr:unnamed protein product [Didymodactylos carnosus]CAF4258792.1 unnamed protein product [Didymodactylos carnosus]